MSSTPATAQAKKEKASEASVISNLAALRFHQSIFVPPLPTSQDGLGDLRVTYSVAGRAADELVVYGSSRDACPLASEDTIAMTPTMLMMGGMFCTRAWGAAIDHSAERAGVRVILIDRPGLGASTPVPYAQRMDFWLHTMRLVLDRLKVRRCVFASHSAGTMYLLNSLYRLGGKYLSPERPLVILLSPWVHPDHSGSKTFGFAASPLLPVSVMNHWASVMGFVQKRVMPSVAWSGGILSAFSPSVPPPAFDNDTAAGEVISVDDETQVQDETAAGGKAGKRKGEDESRKMLLRRKEQEAYGLPEKLVAFRSKTATTYGLAESIQGGTDEAFLCLKKFRDSKSGKDQAWGVADSYPSFCTLLNEQVKQQWRTGVDDSMDGLKLTIEAYFAESDFLIGEKGQAYFEEVFRNGQLVGCGAEGGNSLFEFDSHTISGTDHDSVFFPQSDAWKPIFEKVKWSLKPEE